MRAPKMGIKIIVVLVLIISVITSETHGNLLQTLQHCCSIGTNHGAAGRQCKDYLTPFPNVEKKDESRCWQSVDVCCKNKYRDNQCSLGQEDAMNKKDCTSSDDFRKECCVACQLGIETGTSGQSCNLAPGLPPPYDTTFATCCKNKDLVNSKTSITPSSTSTTPDITSTTTSSTSTTPSSLPDDIYPPLENICEITDVCAQLCIPTADSYRCDCKEGYTLMADGVSCKIKRLVSIPSSIPSAPVNRCNDNNPCEHECKDTGVSILCSCYEGFELDKDKVSCNDIDECKLGLHECLPTQACINEPGSYSCGTDNEDYDMCPEGYVFNSDKKVCDDFDECLFDIICESNQVCVNTVGGYECKDNTVKCPPGFFFKDSIQDCEDIDECILGQHDCNTASQMCLNTKGNFTCIDKTTQGGCPPGFKKNSVTFICEDINECEENEELCGPNETCVNESGGHTCVPNINNKISPYDYPVQPHTTPRIYTIPTTASTTVKVTKPTQPTYYERNPYGRPLPASPSRQPESSPPTRASPYPSYPSRETPSPSIEPLYPSREPPPPSRELPSPSREPPYSSREPSKQPLPPSREPNPSNELDHRYPGSRVPESHPQQPREPERQNQPSPTSPRYERPTSPIPFRPQHSRVPERPRSPYIPPYNPRPLPISCPEGFRYAEEHKTCIDINECHEDNMCDSTQDCINSHGSYYCNCKRGFTKDITGACVDVNECQIGTHDCTEGQRCDNTIGSYYCPRTAGCGTGYTLNHANNICEDDDECILGTDNCKELTGGYQCKNTLGSYRCEKIPRTFYRSSTTFVFPTPYRPEKQYSPQGVLISQQKKCLAGYTMNSEGNCVDIDECKNNPCARSEKCLNLNGRYQCTPRLQCKLGFELNEAGTECLDIDECARGTHQCSSTQICKNGFGYHICTCPPGHTLNVNKHCEDINECEYYRGRACSSNADCINTIGSFECKCHEGLRQSGRDICDDIDECNEIPGLCQQKCVNLWGNYRCSCDRGYTLNSDNRTCTDIDECEKFKDQHLCIGTCQNTAGSYVCQCPRGYRLGSDGRTCQDIDECLENVCGRPDTTCLNTRGSYKCFTIDCPPNYDRDTDHKSRCKRAKYACDQRDQRCLEMPQQYSYHFMTFISKLPIIQGHIDFFQMRGPVWPGSSTDFNMRIVNVNCPEGTERVHDGFFRMNTFKHKAILALVRPIEGPQEIELQLELKLYYNHIFSSKMVAKIFLIVSEYPF